MKKSSSILAAALLCIFFFCGCGQLFDSSETDSMVDNVLLSLQNEDLELFQAQFLPYAFEAAGKTEEEAFDSLQELLSGQLESVTRISMNKQSRLSADNVRTTLTVEYLVKTTAGEYAVTAVHHFLKDGTDGLVSFQMAAASAGV